ncbi:MAG: YggT family protein [Rhodospirillales bacterium]|nr:YggT family protein [Rhodospirillales bacterium]
MSNPFLWLIFQVIDLYMWIIIINIVFSWLVAFNVFNSSNRFVYMIGDFTHRATEPALSRIRRYMPDLGNFDIAPVVLILLLIFLQRFILWGYQQIG